MEDRLPTRSIIAMLSVLCGAAAAAAAAAAGASETPAPAPAPATPQTDAVSPARILAPSQGRPLFVAPGATLPIRLSIQQPGEVAVELRRDEPSRAYPLALPDSAAADLAAGVINATLPPDVPERTYDLVVRIDRAEAVARHCVAVGAPGHEVRLVHLSDLNAGDLCGPELEPRLVEEVNLVNPTLIVATGDYLDATWPQRETGWQQVMDFLARFDAPTLLACGDHDEPELYARFAAAEPIGRIDVGPHRGIVLHDLPAAPVSDDRRQLHWIESAAIPPPRGLTFVVGHDSSPNLLRRWQQDGTLADLVKSARLGLYFAGGHRDWDGREFRNLVTEAAPLLYIRTQRAGPAPRDGAEGVPHFRVVDLERDSVQIPGDSGGPALPPSMAVGRMLVAVDGRNDGSEPSLSFTVANRHPFALEKLAVTLRLKKTGPQPPASSLVRIERLADLGSMWECRAVFDLPDKSSLHASVSTSPPPPPAIEVRFDVPPVIELTPERTADGAAFWSTTAVALVHLENRGDEPAQIAPLVRLDGDPLAYLVPDARTGFATAFKLTLAPGQIASLQLDLSTLRTTPGRRTLQVYLRSDAGWRPYSTPIRFEQRAQ
ncbi:hypothetical protein RAS1_34080 [Phycisphaerae bacterium RAS1]|nr:hypothetical protein RAS1_34080 [Phycisphaerae bacterium RAS1]